MCSFILSKTNTQEISVLNVKSKCKRELVDVSLQFHAGFYYETSRSIGAERQPSRHCTAAHAQHCGYSEPTRLVHFGPSQSRVAVIMVFCDYVTQEQLSGFDKYKVRPRLFTISSVMCRTLACRLAVLCYNWRRDSMRSTGVCRSRDGQPLIVTFKLTFIRNTMLCPLCFGRTDKPRR